MDTKSKPPKLEDAYRQVELAPLAALALVIAEWVKVHGVASLVKRPTVGNMDSSDDANIPR